MAQKLGRVKIIVDGRVIDSEKGAKLNLGGVKRTAIATDGGLVHYSEETEPSTLEFKLPPTVDAPIEDIRKWVGVLAQFEGDNGMRYQVANAFTTEALEVTGGESTPVKMSGEPAERI